MKYRIVSYFLILIIFAIPCKVPVESSADKGVVSPYDDINIYEPGQKVIIIWNGTEEMLYLTTDVYAQRNEYYPRDQGVIKAVEVMPFPSLPEINLSDKKTFQKMNDFLKEKKARMNQYGVEERRKGMSMGSEDYNIPGVYIELNKIIGVHNLTVVRVENIDGFMKWIDNYFQEIRKGNYTEPQRLKDAAEDYQKGGFKYFVFDLIDLSRSSSLNHLSVAPILYTFKTNKVYYPMRISSTASGSGWVKMFIFTDQLISKEDLNDLGFSLDDKIPIVKDDLKRINESMLSLSLQKYLQVYIITSYLYYEDYYQYHDLYLPSSGIYEPPILSTLQIAVVVITIFLIFGAIYLLWKKYVK